MDERLRRLAEHRGGVFSWVDVQGCLLGEHDVRTAIGAGEAVRVRRGAYVLGDRWRDARSAEQLALRARAILLGRPRALASHQSALALHGVAMWGVPTGVVDLVDEVQRTRTVNRVRTHPRDTGLEEADASGCPTVDIATAVVQVALRHGLESGVVALDHALHEHRCRRSDVQVAGARLARGPLDRARIKALLDRCDPRCESVGETRTRLLLQDLATR